MSRFDFTMVGTKERQAAAERVELYVQALRRQARKRDPLAWDRVNLARARGAAMNREYRLR